MRRTMRNVLCLLVVLLPVVLATLAVPAQEPREKIARVSISQGETSYQRGDDQDWNALGANTPLMTGDSLYAAQDGRAEIELGDGNTVRLDNSTAVDIVNLSDEITQLGLSQGYVNVRVRNIPTNHTVEVDTPLAAATFWEPGLYRVGLEGDTAHFGVVSGRLSVVLNGEQLDVDQGEILDLRGGNDPDYGYSRLSAANAFDQWSEGRDARRQRSTSSRYVNSAVIGYDDLDDHGSWRQDRTYGNVWYPTHVSNDWAPYQTGRWMWQDPYGWTWVSYESWGWAPYHYGRWVNVGNSWGWIPPPPIGYRGPRVVMNIQPYYSPALVAFVGGSNWSVGISVGGGGGGFVGWVPLAPADPYAYYWQRPVQATNVVYQNITIVNSVTVVNYNNFTNGPVARIQVAPDVIRRAPVMGVSVIGITPGRASLAPYPGVKLPPRAIPARAVMDRPLVVRSMPPPKPVSFDHKVAEIQKTGKPYARPVAMDANVGKPFKPGMKAPDGVVAKPALGIEGGTQQPKLKAKQGQQVRLPKPVERDVVKPTEKPQKLGGPEGQPVPEKIKKDKPLQPSAQPGTGQPEQPQKNKQLKPPAQPGTGQPEQPQKNKQLKPPAQPGTGQPEQPQKNKQLKPPAQPGTGQPEQPQKNKQLKPPAQPGTGQPEQPQKNKQLKPPAQPGTGQPEQPQKNKQLKPPAQPGTGQPEQPQKNKQLKPPAQPGTGQPEQPQKNKQLKPPAQPGTGQPEKAKKQEGTKVPPKKPTNPDQVPPPGEEEKVK